MEPNDSLKEINMETETDYQYPTVACNKEQDNCTTEVIDETANVYHYATEINDETSTVDHYPIVDLMYDLRNVRGIRRTEISTGYEKPISTKHIKSQSMLPNDSLKETNAETANDHHYPITVFTKGQDNCTTEVNDETENVHLDASS